MKILLLGKDGQVGWELQRALAPLGELVACGRLEANLEDLAGLRALVRRVAPEVLVNAAAYTAVDRAETDAGRAQRINAEAPGVLAEEMARCGGWLVHYSTDYVFDGGKAGWYEEGDATAPLGVYGLTKRDGELAVQLAGGRHLIFRTSWVYGAHGANFARTMLRLAAEREELRVVADQYGAPTGAELLADVTALCLARLAHDAALAARAGGLYHLVAAGETSWHGFARNVIAEARARGAPLKVADDAVHAIATADYPTPARRPANSRLATAKLQRTFGLCMPAWEAGVRRVVAELIAKGSA